MSIVLLFTTIVNLWRPFTYQYHGSRKIGTPISRPGTLGKTSTPLQDVQWEHFNTAFSRMTIYDNIRWSVRKIVLRVDSVWKALKHCRQPGTRKQLACLIQYIILQSYNVSFIFQVHYKSKFLSLVFAHIILRINNSHNHDYYNHIQLWSHKHGPEVLLHIQWVVELNLQRSSESQYAQKYCIVTVLHYQGPQCTDHFNETL